MLFSSSPSLHFSQFIFFTNASSSGEMEGFTPNSYSRRLDSYISLENSKWLAENVEGVDEILREFQRLAEVEYSEVKEAESCDQQKPEVVAHATRICHMYKLLAERYDQLTEEVRLQIPSLLNVKHSAINDNGSEHASPLQTPNQKLTSTKMKHDGDFKVYPSSGSGSPDSSLKEASEYSVSSDSESESFYSTINKDIVSPMSVKSKVPHGQFAEQTEPRKTETIAQKISGENADGIAKVRESEDYDMLFRRLAACEEELIITREKLHVDNARLEGELKKQQSITVLIDNLNVQLHEAQQSIQMRDADLEMEKRKVLELQYQVAESQFQIDDSKSYVELLMEELKMYREKLKGSEEELVKLKSEHCNEVSEGIRQFQSQIESAHKEIALLEAKLDSERDQVAELQEIIIGYVADISQRDQEITALKDKFSDAHSNFSVEKELLESDLYDLSEQNSGLLQENTKLNAIVKEFEAQIRSLQTEINCCKSEKMEMQEFHDAQVINMQLDIENIKAEAKAKGEQVEALNRNLDMLKLKYDMLMANKDELNAKLENLNAELSSKNDEIREMNNHLNQLHMENVEMIAESERAKKHEDELKDKVVELQNEVDRQVAVISDRAEEKREAIRQLCFSVEYYRNGYQELRQVFTGLKHRTVLAS
ncbi:NAB domain-containing protein [Heracleum sosnowskyi]|uniref:NAB domain-containing protein n=1 Tax=Heracleum sosnowskyi TaxID=360622 RepID=A0AAD8MBH5_9APIA|nr:NAB domain-containing protein [Heracleum sosnowskyi]